MESAVESAKFIFHLSTKVGKSICVSKYLTSKKSIFHGKCVNFPMESPLAYRLMFESEP